MSHHTIRHREESSAREIIRVWWRRWCRRLFLGLGLMLAGVPVSFLGMYLIDEFNRQNPKPELFALGGLAFAFAGGIVSVAGLLLLFMNAIGVLVGHERAGKSPNRTLERFYYHAVTEAGMLARYFGKSQVGVDAMFYLHANAVETIGGWAGFEAHWKEVNGEILQHGSSICTKPIASTEVKISKILPLETSDLCHRYRVSIAVSSFYSKQGEWMQSYVENDLQMENGRWYLASAKWAGVLDGEGVPGK